MKRLILTLCFAAGPAMADTIVAAHTIRAKSVIERADLASVADVVPGSVTDPSLLVGSEARVTLYAGRPIRSVDVGPPAVIERNQLITMIYAQGVVLIRAEGRALDRAGIGDRVRAMNLASRSTVVGIVLPDGRIMIEGNT